MSEEVVEGEIEKNIGLVQKLLNYYVSKRRKEKVEKMFDKIGVHYFSAPASSKKQFHYAFPGGLAKHSINVYRNLIKLNKNFELNFDSESVLIVSLFHDLGKAVNVDLEPHYVPVKEQWRIEKYGQLYDKDYGSIYMPNHQRTMYLLHKFGIPLSAEEYQAILLNDMYYLEENKGYKNKECKLAIYLHMADMISAQKEHEEEQEN